MLLITQHAIKLLAQRCLSPGKADYPRAFYKGGIMTDMLIMAAGQLSHPVGELILMKANDRLAHRRG